MAELLEFLRTVDARQTFVIGDLIDFRALRRALYWPREQQEVLRALLDRARRGIEIRRDLAHKSADGLHVLP